MKKSISIATCILIVAQLASSSAVTLNSATLAGNQLTITGFGLNGIKSVTFNGAQLQVVSNSPDQVVLSFSTFPAPGTYRIVVKAAAGSAVMYANVPRPAILSGFCDVVQNGGTYLVGLGNTSTFSAGCYGGESSVAPIAMPLAGTLANLTVSSNGGGYPTVLTLMVNGASTTMTCTISDSQPNCSDNSDLVQINAGDQIGVFAQPNGINSLWNIRATLEFR